MSPPEPTANVVFNTSKGPLTIELWAKEMPKACRAFLEACSTGKYDHSEFFRVSQAFVQAGPLDPQKFTTEFNSRLRLESRGTIACASDGDMSTTQIIITRGNGSIPGAGIGTIIGRLTAESVFVMEKIASGAVDGEKPLYPVVIKSVAIQVPYFDLPKPQLRTVKPSRKVVKRQLNVFDESDSDDEPVKKRPNPMLQPRGAEPLGHKNDDTSEAEHDRETKDEEDSNDHSQAPQEENNNLERKPQKSEMLTQLLAFEAQLDQEMAVAEV